MNTCRKTIRGVIFVSCCLLCLAATAPGLQAIADSEPPPRSRLLTPAPAETTPAIETRETARSHRGEASPGEPSSAPRFDLLNYRLAVGDHIKMTVFEEPGLSFDGRIAREGQIRLPLLGNRSVLGMSVSEAEGFIEKLYVDERLLRNPIVTLAVVEYAPKEISILGAVRTPGNLQFPIEAEKMGIVDVVSRVGGFTGIARANRVRVTRTNDDGEEEIFHVDVESMIRGDRGNREPFHVLPGDVIWVPERMF